MRPALAAFLLATLVGGPARAAAPAPDVGATVDLLLDTARAYALRARWDDAERLLERASALSTGASENRQVAVKVQWARVLTSRATYQDQPFERALAVSEQALSGARALTDAELLGDALQAWAVVRYDLQFHVAVPDYAPVRRALQEALDLRERQKDPRRLAETLFYLGLVHERLDELADGQATYERALPIALRAGDRLMQSYLYRHLADYQKPARGLAGVLDYHQRCLRLREDIGFATGIVFAALAVGDTLLEMKQPEQAVSQYERALAAATRIDVARGAAYAYGGLATAQHAAGRSERAREHAREALAAAVRSQDAELLRQVLESVAPVLGPPSSSAPI